MHLVQRGETHEMLFTPFPNEIYTSFSFFGFIMCIIPLPWHLKAWNVGTCLFMFWAGLACLAFSVNSILWHGHAFNTAPIWCDISAKITVGTVIGIPASSLCINRRLYVLQLDPLGNFTTTKSDRIRSLTIDLGIALGFPILIIILHYVAQRHRFDIFEDIGCSPDHNNWVSFLLMNVPPVLLGLSSATYGICAIISINKRRKEFNELLARRQKITSSLYFRLMCFAGIEALTTTPVAVYFIVQSMTTRQSYPWISWQNSGVDVHRVDQYPAIIWHNFPIARAYESVRWIPVVSAFMFFSIFGFAEEAKSRYRLIVKFFLKLTGFRVGCQTESLPPDPAERLTFANERPYRADFSTIPMISILPDCGQSGAQWSPSRAALFGTQDYPGDHLRSQMGPDSLGNSLTSTTNARVPAAVEQEAEQTPCIRNTQNLHSFLDFGQDDAPTQHISSAHSSQMDISTIEEGQPSKANRRSSNRVSWPLRSFLNLN